MRNLLWLKRKETHFITPTGKYAHVIKKAKNKYVRDVFFLLFFLFVYFTDDELHPFEKRIKRQQQQKSTKALRLRSLAFTSFLVFRNPDKTLPRL